MCNEINLFLGQLKHFQKIILCLFIPGIRKKQFLFNDILIYFFAQEVNFDLLILTHLCDLISISISMTVILIKLFS